MWENAFLWSWYYSEITKVSPYCWYTCSHSSINNDKIHFTGSFSHLHNSTPHVPAERPLRSVLWLPEGVSPKLTTHLCLAISPVLKSHVALSQEGKRSVPEVVGSNSLMKLGCCCMTEAKRTMFRAQMLSSLHAKSLQSCPTLRPYGL